MYIQPTSEPLSAVQLPRDYAGTAFSQAEDPTPPEEETKKEECAEPTPTEESAPTVAVSATPKKATPLSFLTSSPLFRSLLPPPRQGRAEGEDPWQWLLLGAALLLFFSDKGDDFLPLLLILLLWD